MFRYRTTINWTGQLYEDNISHPKIIKIYKDLFNNYYDILKLADWVTIRLSPDLEPWIIFSNFKIAKLEIILPYNVYWNDYFISGEEWVNEKFLIGDKLISQTQRPHDFFQNYLGIRTEIYQYLANFKAKNLILIGGEFYLYSQLIPHQNLVCYTDCLALVESAKRNNPDFPVSHVDYRKNLDINADLIVINVSRTGLKPELAQQIKNSSSEIIYIGCKRKYVERDVKILGGHLKIFRSFDELIFLAYLKKRIIPLGSDCCVAYQLKKLGFREAAYPFDWLRINLEDVITLMTKNFRDLFVDIYFKRKSENYRFGINENEEEVKTEFGSIWRSKIYPSLEFCHDFVDDLGTNLESVKRKYQKRIDRFLLDIDSSILVHWANGKIKQETVDKWNFLIRRKIWILNQEKEGTDGYVNFVKVTTKFTNWQRDDFDWSSFFDLIN